jgi:hypothetical protein
MGFAAGLQAGERLGQGILDAYNQSQQQKEYARIEKEKPVESEGYTRAQGLQMEDLAKSGGYDIVPQYAPAAEGETQGKFLGYQAVSKYQGDGWDGPAAPQDFRPQQVTEFLGQRYEGGLTPERADALRARAYADVISRQDPIRGLQLRKDAALMEREAQEAPLRLEGLRQQVKLGGQQLETGDLTIAEKRRLADDAQRMSNFGNAYGEANAQALAENRTLSATDIANLAKQHKLTFGQENEVIASHVNRTKSEVEQFRLDVEKVTQGKNFEQLIDLHKNDKRFGDGMHFIPEVDKKTGGIVLARVNEATGKVEERLPFKTKAEATAYLREEAVNPANAAIWLQNYKKGETGIEANQAQIRASDSTVALNAAKADQTRMQSSILKMNVENNTEAKALQTELAKLDEESDPTGSRRANLIAQFNMLAVGPGKTIPMGGAGGKGGLLKQAVDTKKNDDGTYTAYRRDTGEAIYNTYNGEQIPLGMEIDAYKKMKETARSNGVELIRGEDNGRLVLKYAGADGKYYDDPQKAKYAKPAPAAASAKDTGLDTSPKTVVPASIPTAPTAKPVREPNESFSAFKDRTIAWDRNRMAYEQYLNDQRVREMLKSNASGLQLNTRPLVN